jgi:hypothetical protein
LLIDAYKKDFEDKLWQQWLVIYPDMIRMGKENFISFENFKKEAFKPKLEKVDVKEVLKDAESIKAMDQGAS